MNTLSTSVVIKCIELRREGKGNVQNGRQRNKHPQLQRTLTELHFTTTRTIHHKSSLCKTPRIHHFTPTVLQHYLSPATAHHQLHSIHTHNHHHVRQRKQTKITLQRCTSRSHLSTHRQQITLSHHRLHHLHLHTLNTLTHAYGSSVDTLFIVFFAKRSTNASRNTHTS